MRKTIGICVSGYNWEVESKVVQGICTEALNNDVNVLIFSSLLNERDIRHLNADSRLIIKGESEIFNLINYKKVDGIIIISGTIVSQDAVNGIISNCEKYNIPLINVNSNHPKIKYNIEVEGISAFDTLLEHLIVDHKCKTLNFIGGIPQQNISEKRLDSYKKILKKHNIPVEEKRIGYGYFWDRAVDVVKGFIKDDVLPDAIVCANDTMAIFVMDFLINSGYKIPEDVIVTGYDGITDGERYHIPVTSVMHDYIKAGKISYSRLIDLIDGKEISEKNRTEIVSSLLLKRNSCGCNKNANKISDFFGENYQELVNYQYFTNNLASMTKISGASESSEGLFEGLMKGLELFNFTRVYININSEITKKSELFHDASESDKKYGLSKKMISMVRKGHDVKIGTEFSIKEMIPENVLDLEKPILLSFTPMYFKDRFLGYVVIEPWKINGNGSLFNLWSLTASNLVGSFYANSELENLYMTDPLTGLYNRRGMKKYFNEALKIIKENNEYCGIICADIDNLKTINDKYGHEAGDIAITTSAKALYKSLPKGSICVKTGGDEFCALIHSKNELDMEKLISKIYDFLDKFNEKSSLPYKVYCSCGFCMEQASELKNLTEIQNKADKDLYIEKNARKSRKQV